MAESQTRGGLFQPRAPRRPGAAIALVAWTLVALLWFKVIAGDSGVVELIWYASDVLTCLVGLAVVTGRTVVGRGDTWQPALITVGASFCGPLSALLLAVPPVRRSVRDVPVQWRARNEGAPLDRTPDQAPPPPRAGAEAGRHEDEPYPAPAELRPAAETGPLRHTPAQAATAHRRGASVALGLVAATLAFWSALLAGVWIGLAGGTLTDGNWFGIGVAVALVVGTAGFVCVLAAQSFPTVLSGVQYAAAAAMLAAVVCIAAEGGDLHWNDGSRQSIGFLYPMWLMVAILFVLGAVVAGRPSRNQRVDVK